MLAAYRPEGVVHHIGVVYPKRDNRLRVFIPNGHALAPDTLATLHLDNRTGVDELDAELRVYRVSYKGRVLAVEENWLELEPVEFMLMHGMQCVEEQREPGYRYPHDDRPLRPLATTPLSASPSPEIRDHDNKVGVLTALARGQPHTTVLAFLSSVEDDVFLVSMPGTFKSQVLKREPRCFFTIDERATFTFERSVEWNYTILQAQAHLVPAQSPVYEEIRSAFIHKNPWESVFFLSPELEMFHLKCLGVVCAGEVR